MPKHSRLRRVTAFLCSRRGTHSRNSRGIRLDVVIVAGRVNIHLKRQTTRIENPQHEQVVQRQPSTRKDKYRGRCNSFNKLRLQKEKLEEKHLHLLQTVESEKAAISGSIHSNARRSR
ncbi:uncharacterized protein LOC122532848 isoform X2 [Frieseomelitta varia]|uniref:uncharacterized protein LOC122532848 isoform X2 n=1 Tax=Frieseomelitta varia TaxID=561572 RepID=UPI001CB67F8B|nr:uncharacterized protein LOC122532848 isoform X2 [Frieseomelitta varia]